MNTAIKGTYRARLGAEREAGRAGRQEPGTWRCRAAAALGPAPWVLGIAFVVMCLVSRTAGAVPLTTLPQVVAVSGAVAVTDTKATPGATTANGASFPSITVNKYIGTDILTGVQLQLTSTRTPSGTVTASGGTLPRNATGTGSGTGQFTLPGVMQTFPAVTASSACTKTTGSSSCTASTTGAAQPTNTTFHVTTGLAKIGRAHV